MCTTSATATISLTASPRYRQPCSSAILELSLVPLALSMLGHVARVATSWRRFNRVLHSLERMSDRELAARGISRSDVIRVAMEHSGS